jgi:hypothetical protein
MALKDLILVSSSPLLLASLTNSILSKDVSMSHYQVCASGLPQVQVNTSTSLHFEVVAPGLWHIAQSECFFER